MNALKQIVVGIDFSESSRTALKQGVRLGRAAGAAVTAVHVVEKSMVDQVGASMESPPGDLRDRIAAHARYGIERMVAEFPEAKDTGVQVVVGHPAAELVRVSEKPADGGGCLLVMGAFGQSHATRGVGTTASRCVRHGTANALLVRPEQSGAFRRVISCVDFSETSLRALREAARLAAMDKAALVAINVFSPPPPAYPPADMIGLWPIPAPDYGQLTVRLRESAQEALAKTVADVKKEFPDLNIVPAVVEDFSYAKGICGYAKEHAADLVVIGTHGHSNLRYMLLGSTAEKVLREVHCSVFAVKPPAEEKR
jgi:nucleotide-binding universal stress UspA family protein